MNIDPHGRHIRRKGCTGVSQNREQGGLTPTLTEKKDTKIITCTSPTGTLKVQRILHDINSQNVNTCTCRCIYVHCTWTCTCTYTCEITSTLTDL